MSSTGQRCIAQPLLRLLRALMRWRRSRLNSSRPPAGRQGSDAQAQLGEGGSRLRGRRPPGSRRRLARIKFLRAFGRGFAEYMPAGQFDLLADAATIFILLAD